MLPYVRSHRGMLLCLNYLVYLYLRAQWDYPPLQVVRADRNSAKKIAPLSVRAYRTLPNIHLIGYQNIISLYEQYLLVILAR